MKIASAIYLVFTAIVFLLQQIVCLYRDISDSLTKTTLIACKLLSAGDFMKRLILAQAAVMVIIPRYNKVQKPVHYNRLEAKDESTHVSHSMKAIALRSVRRHFPNWKQAITS